MDASGGGLGVLISVPSGISAALECLAIDFRDVVMRTIFEGDKELLAYIRARQEIDLPNRLGISNCPYVNYDWVLGNGMKLRRVGGIFLVKNGYPSSI